MTLASLVGMNYGILGGLSAEGPYQRPIAVASVTQDASLESTHMVGQLWWEDGGSHTVDTTGSSKVEFRTGTTTFANVGTSFSVGLATVDTTNGPPVRAVNVVDAITFDVAWVGLGNGGGITTSAWQSLTPTTGTKTIAHGDLLAFCTQMTTRAGADSVLTSCGGAASHAMPTITSFTGGAYAQVATLPNCVVIASDGTRGYIYGAGVLSVALASVFNSGSSPSERGNLITLPGPTRVIGITANVIINANLDLVFYSDATGTPVARGTISVDTNAVGASNNFTGYFAPYTAATGTYAVICKPGASNVTLNGVTLSNANYQNSYSLGVGGNAVNRSSGAFTQQNSGLDRYAIGIIIDQIDDGASGGGPVGHQST